MIREQGLYTAPLFVNNIVKKKNKLKEKELCYYRGTICVYKIIVN